MTTSSFTLFRPTPSRKIEMGFVSLPDASCIEGEFSAKIFQFKDVTDSMREVVINFDLKGRLLGIELTKWGDFSVKILERTFQGDYLIYRENCKNLDPDSIETNYYYDYYQEHIAVDSHLAKELCTQVFQVLKETLSLKSQSLKTICTQFDWEGLERERKNYLKVYPTPLTILPPEVRPDLNPLFTILQITQGCWTHLLRRGPCAFCASYRGVPYYEKTEEELLKQLHMVKEYTAQGWPQVRKIFLADADPLNTKKSSETYLHLLRERIPHIPWYESFVSTHCILSKNADQWRTLMDLGLKKVYWGVESAHDKTLKLINKPHTQKMLYQAAERMDSIGLDYVVILMSGIGQLNKEYSASHVKFSAAFVSKINCSLVDISKFDPKKGTMLFERIEKKELHLPSFDEIEEEHRALISSISFNKPHCKIRGSYGQQFVFN